MDGGDLGESEKEPGGVCPPGWVGSFLRQRILQAKHDEASSHVGADLEICWKLLWLLCM